MTDEDLGRFWLAVYDNGDYYCEGGHIIGLYSTRQKATEAIKEFQEHNSDPAYSYEILSLELDKPEEWWDDDAR